ncbi:glycosyltransferase family 2 protein [Haloarchaeobius sp. HME9146]|uniref:glycosyltransferase n=1 Tax=Haloarchaeobius sp. HME9146 TaxID=2978732 RepID=UPI0021C11AE3|nr:glycosyltransferase family 2 protein [Haloarchaeobius sp. HME9146]MCT9095308.1 glycosyltransferase family 2 protein [Haloarchaeobius sp. HME9146]
MKLERYALSTVTAVLLLAATAVVVPGAVPATVPGETLLELTLWTTTLLFGATAAFWFVLTYVVGQGYESPAPAYDGDDVQVRILTIDAADVVQATVDSLPAELTDVRVIAEEPISVDGAEVHVVPDDFECEAVRKGRAIEWARRTLACEREFVCYLDEDSVVESWNGLPDADVVQLREQPRRTGSVLSYLADVYRMGVQLEQRAFARLQIPLFAWGGGIAVRSDLEDAVTWNRETIVEDTAFVWAAAREHDISFALSETTCRNEAPPSLTEILQQRRRWAAGNVQAASMLPARYRLLTRVRNYAWALSPIVTLVAVPLSVLGVSVVYGSLFVLASLTLAAFTVFWYLRGVAYYGGRALKWAAVLPLVPLVSLVHSMGTIAGILHPPDGFRVTTKVGPDG